MVPTFKPVVLKRLNADGSQSVLIRIYYDGKQIYLQTGIRLLPAYWNPKGSLDKRNWVRPTHSTASTFNSIIQASIERLHQIVQTLTIDQGIYTLDDILVNYKADDTANGLLSFTQLHYEKLVKEGKIRSAKKFHTILTYLRYQTGGEEIPFSRVNTLFIEDLIQQQFAGLAGTTVEKYLKAITALLNQAKKAKLIPESVASATKGIKIKKLPVEKFRLTLLELERFEAVQLPIHENIWWAQKAFLVATYAHGMRISDVLALRWEMIDRPNMQLSYTMYKTKKKMVIPMNAALIRVLDTLPEGNGLVFPQLEKVTRQVYVGDDWVNYLKRVESVTANFNENLKLIAKQAGINGRVTLHTARHSFADLLRKKGVDIKTIGMSLGHESIATTIAYLKSFDSESVKNAVDGLFD